MFELSALEYLKLHYSITQVMHKIQKSPRKPAIVIIILKYNYTEEAV